MRHTSGKLDGFTATSAPPPPPPPASLLTSSHAVPFHPFWHIWGGLTCLAGCWICISAHIGQSLLCVSQLFWMYCLSVFLSGGIWWGWLSLKPSSDCRLILTNVEIGSHVACKEKLQRFSPLSSLYKILKHCCVTHYGIRLRPLLRFKPGSENLSLKQVIWAEHPYQINPCPDLSSDYREEQIGIRPVWNLCSLSSGVFTTEATFDQTKF